MRKLFLLLGWSLWCLTVAVIWVKCSPPSPPPRVTPLPPKVVPWEEYFLNARHDKYDDPSLALFRRTERWVMVKVSKYVKIATVTERMPGKPEIITVVVREKGSDRPEILKLHKYHNMIFVTSDISPDPDSVDVVLIAR